MEKITCTKCGKEIEAMSMKQALHLLRIHATKHQESTGGEIPATTSS